MLIEEPLQQPRDKLIRPALGRAGLVYSGNGVGDALGGELVLVCNEDSLVLEIWVLLQTLDLGLCGVQDLLRKDSMHATDDFPLAGDVVLSNELVDEVERGKLETGYLGRAVPDARLAMTSVLRLAVSLPLKNL